MGRRSAADASSAAQTWLIHWYPGPSPNPTMPGGPCLCPAMEDYSGWMYLGWVWGSGWAAAGLEMGVRTPVGRYLRQPSPPWDSRVPVSSACWCSASKRGPCRPLTLWAAGHHRPSHLVPKSAVTPSLGGRIH